MILVLPIWCSSISHIGWWQNRPSLTGCLPGQVQLRWLLRCLLLSQIFHWISLIALLIVVVCVCTVSSCVLSRRPVIRKILNGSHCLTWYCELHYLFLIFRIRTESICDSLIWFILLIYLSGRTCDIDLKQVIEWIRIELNLLSKVTLLLVLILLLSHFLLSVVHRIRELYRLVRVQVSFVTYAVTIFGWVLVVRAHLQLLFRASLIKGKNKLIFLSLIVVLLWCVLHLIEKALVESFADDFVVIELGRHSTLIHHLLLVG